MYKTRNQKYLTIADAGLKYSIEVRAEGRSEITITRRGITGEIKITDDTKKRCAKPRFLNVDGLLYEGVYYDILKYGETELTTKIWNNFFEDILADDILGIFAESRQLHCSKNE